MFNYDEANEYLSGLLRFGIKFGLERFAELCRRMGNPQDSLKVIHVGGTNGKGSTCAFITSILSAAGQRVGTYLSPYVYDVRERIQINGEPIPKDDFAALVREIAPHLDAIAQTDLGQGTEFEVKTLMAFLYFARRNVDYAVIEVGMGGRYDCTNVVHPLVAVITNVSLDHTERLGDTIEKIAWDKAGIAKPGVPLITAADAEFRVQSSECRVQSAEFGVQSSEFREEAWRTIYTTARDQGVTNIWRVLRAGCEPPTDSPKADRIVRFYSKGGQVSIELPTTPFSELCTLHSELRLAGDFQYANAATAAAAAAALGSAGASPSQSTISNLKSKIPSQSTINNQQSAIEEGLASAYLPGRLEVLRRNPTVIIDAAHNPDGAEKLADSIRKLFHWRKLILIIGMLSTHSAEGVLEALAPLADEIIATAPGWEKARPASEVAEVARRINPNVRILESVPVAVRAALDTSSEDDLILVTGSFYTIGEVDRQFVQERGRR